MSHRTVNLKNLAIPALILAAGLFLFSGGSPSVTLESLEEAAIEGNLSDTQYLLEEGVDPNGRLEFGQTPMHSAAWRGHTDLVLLMIDHGGDPNRRNGSSGETPLISAVRGNRPGTASELLDAGADPDLSITASSVQCASGISYSAGSTPMDIARQSDFDQVLAVLERH